MIDSRIADLSDNELENLYGNAIRLAESGNERQVTEAERMLPVIGAELEVRARARAASIREKREEKLAAQKLAARTSVRKGKRKQETAS